MKVLYTLLIVLIFNPLFSNGQERNFQFQFGKTFFTSGDLWGNAFGCTYNRKIAKNTYGGIQIQNSRSSIKTEEVVPNFVNNENQINSTKLVLNLNQSVFKSKINIGFGYGLQLYQKYSNGGIRHLIDPNAPTNLQYAMESGRFNKESSGVFHGDLNLNLCTTAHFSIWGNFSIYKSKLNTELISSLKLTCPILKN